MYVTVNPLSCVTVNPLLCVTVNPLLYVCYSESSVVCYSESSVVCYSDSGTFLGLGTVTGSVAIYIAFSLQVMAAVGTSPWEGYKLTLSALMTQEGSGPVHRGSLLGLWSVFTRR